MGKVEECLRAFRNMDGRNMDGNMRKLSIKMLHAIPALPVGNMERSMEFYGDKLGFTLAFQTDGFAILQRDAVEIHLWEASDNSWRSRDGSPPVISGAESFIAGTASCRVGVEGVDGLYRVLQPLGVVHSRGQLEEMPWGTREFGVVDPDNNLITFFERSKDAA